MEEFLKDSPSDFGSNYNFEREENRNGIENANSQTKRVGFDLENPTYYNKGDQDVQQGNQYAAPMYDNRGMEENYYRKEAFPNEFGNQTQGGDNYLDELEAFQFAQQQPQYMDFSQPNTNNLDELISPSNAPIAEGQNINDTANKVSFLNPQYFSPPNASGFGGMNPVKEDTTSAGHLISPLGSRHGSISAPFVGDNYTGGVDINAGSYLSPQSNPQFMSPNLDNSLDAFKSPSFNSKSYLSSPHSAFKSLKYENRNPLSNSIPRNISDEKRASSPIPDRSLGTSLPDTGSAYMSGSNKPLSKEEKLKRRREFHNAVERRRRDLIKERIKELGMLVPPSMLNPQLCAVQSLQRNSKLNTREINELLSSIKVKETKPNKSTILNKSVDYINHLKYVLEQQAKTREALTNRIKELEASDKTKAPLVPTENAYNFPDQEQEDPEVKFEGNDNVFDPDDFFLESLNNDESGLLT